MTLKEKMELSPDHVRSGLAMTLDERANEIAKANDLLRRTCIGKQLEISPGVTSLTPSLIAEALTRMRMFDDFTPQNDPYKEHDFGSFDIDGYTFLFKIETHNNQSRKVRPTDALASSATKRTCTLMLSSEYDGLLRYPQTMQDSMVPQIP